MSEETREIRNRDALRDYAIDEVFEAGIVLTGAEVKSIRTGNASFTGGYAGIDNKGAWLYGLHIDPYKFASKETATAVYDPVRPRKLLIKASQIADLKARTQAEGFTLVPMKIYFKKALIKVAVGLGKGKKKFDKRDDLRDRDVRRETDRYFKMGRKG